MPNVVQALFVAWQNPDTRRFYPVARLAHVESSGCDGCFEFVYIHGATTAEGFLPFLSFPDLKQLYRSQDLFPMFDNRLVSPKRADYSEFMSQLGLPLSTTSPITILSRSTGRRATDTLELFPLPEFEEGYGYRTWFWAHGLRHLTTDGHKRLLRLTAEEMLYPQCEPSNPVDSDAIELLSIDGQRVGYMPSYLLDDAHTLQDICEICEVYVDRVNLPPAPLHQRLLCRLESCWPESFTPYSSERYEPLAAGAAIVAPPVLE